MAGIQTDVHENAILTKLEEKEMLCLFAKAGRKGLLNWVLS